MDLSRRIIRTSIDWSGDKLALADFLAGRFTYRSKAEWCERINSGEITLNGTVVSPETVLALHDQIEYRPGDIVEPPADLDYRIVFEDEKILVIDKPGNLCMHPAGPFFKHTLWHLLCSKYGDIHFINRLDRETSGLLLAAKDPESARSFARKDNFYAKVYQVLVHGRFDKTVNAAGFLHPAGGVIRKRRAFSYDRPEFPPFESASTHFIPLRTGEKFSLLRAELDTGRRHQIRATLCSLGFPVVGDKLYGVDEKFYLKQKDESFTDEDRQKLLISRQALHATELSFTLPGTTEIMSFTSPLPAELDADIFKE
jgi:23S rRNA pseudouridine955/2504/2580 synthase/23S rRNA pseudouridine1911/1915/1917 synthase